MRRGLAVVLALAALVGVPGAHAGAEDPTPDQYQTNFANIIGIIGAGGADWYVSYPTNVPTTGTYHVAVTASTTAAATANIALTAGSFQGSGCTVGAFTSDTAATSQASGYFPVTTTAAHCFGSVRLAITSGSTTITAIRASFQIASDTVTVTDDANGWALTGIPDTQEEIQAIADALVDGVTVKMCGQDGACGPIVTVTNTTVTIGTANVNSTTPDAFTVTVKNKSYDDTLPLLLLLAGMVYAWLRMHRTGWKWLWPLVIFVLAVLSTAAVFLTTNKPLAAAVVVIVAMTGLMALINGFGLGRARE